MPGFHGNKARRVSIRVHFNQLALFTDNPVESAAQEAEVDDDGKDSARRGDPEALAGELPADGAGYGEQNRLDQAVFEAQTQAGDLLYELVSVKKMTYQAAWELAAQEWSLPQSENQSENGKSTSGEIHVSDIAPEQARPPPRDFRITEAHRIGQGGLKEKARDNIAAIRTLKTRRRRKPRAYASRKICARPLQRWGALSNVFHPYPRSDWEEIARDVRQNLTPEEYDSARGSTPNAHFTSPMVIEALWQAMAALRAGGGRADP